MTALCRGGRQRNLEKQARKIRVALRAPQLTAPALMVEAQAATTSALVAVITTLDEQIARLEADLVEAFEHHPDAEILRSLPGLGDILGARVLAEFGDAPDRYTDATARHDYAGTAPVTRASGTSRVVVARLARNKRLFDATYGWAFCALSRSGGARDLAWRRATPEVPCAQPVGRLRRVQAAGPPVQPREVLPHVVSLVPSS